MIKKYKILTNQLLLACTEMQIEHEKRLKELRKYEGMQLKRQERKNGRIYYSTRIKDTRTGKHRERYIGRPTNEKVKRIQEARFLNKSISAMGKNIDLLQMLLNKLQDVDTASINDALPKAYRSVELLQSQAPNSLASEWKKRSENYKLTFPPFHPEELIHPTDDGNHVRSKSEQSIYNFLLSLGVTFVYELPLETKVRKFFPDFTILSEVDYKTVYLIEHQGKMNDATYRERYKKRVYEYLCAGYVQGVNIFYTFDYLNGSFDKSTILDIIHLKIRPQYPPPH